MQKRYLSPEYLAAAQEYREMRKKLNELLRKKKAERTEKETSQIDQLKQSMKENAQQQKVLLQEHLSKVSSNILSSNFRFNLTPDPSKYLDKPLYTIGATAEEFFAMQVLCRNVKKLFKISMSSRDEILSQLKMLLREDKSRYYIIRTDVCDCFESIPHAKLFEYLEGNNLLDVKSKSLLRGLIRKEFEAKNLRPLVPTPQTGIPRGCAISSLLSEFYLSKIDEVIRRTLPGIVFMARYVDDIIIVAHPDLDDEHHWSLDDYVKALTDAYAKNGLIIHTPTDGTNKCYTYDSKDTKNLKFDLLGYTIQSVKGDKEKQGFFSLSKKKKDKIKDRIIKTFQKFETLLNTVSYDIAAHYLFDALHVLTCNINLYNAKRGVKVGIFYSNQLLDNIKDLEGLDRQLQHSCGQISLKGKAYIDPAKQPQIEATLKKQLKQVSFVKGFAMPHKRYKVKKNRLQMIKQSWV
ncbi:antiviral reverse transcriptase Drt3a [Porphyromonas levii]|uniref:antiviral reverse transcriptase Drt3a n=1 Tax=Porphyromonas levii TaxID=28114 RepID=UPI0020136FDD|nr:antiviral reverse transcriptase Drt3a [Porphyromonas levii]